MARWNAADGDDLLTYNAQDSVATGRNYLGILAEPDWSTPRCQRLFDIHTRLSQLAAEMHSNGFQVIESNRMALVNELTELSVQRHKALLKHIGGKKGNPAFKGTDNDMRALLYSRHAKPGIQCYDIEEPDEWDDVMWTNDQKNTLAVDKEALLRVFINPAIDESVRDAIQMFWYAKAPNKALTTWVDSDGVKEKIGADGRMRCEWNSAGTETMRWSGELMTLPEEKDDESLGGRLPNIRSMYGARKGHKLWHWDWSMQELRMQFAIGGDPALGNAIKAGDVYSFDAHTWFPQQLERLFGPEWRTVNLKKQWKNGRRQCKVGHLGAMYMAGAVVMWTQGLIQDRKITFGNMKSIRAMFHATYHKWIEWASNEQQRIEQAFADRRFSECYSEGRILGGRRQYPAVPPITETCNFPIQRTAGEMGALAMLAIADKFKKYKVKALVLTNEHDAGTYEIKDNRQTERDVEDIVMESVQGPWHIEGKDHMFPAKGKAGRTWAEACED